MGGSATNDGSKADDGIIFSRFCKFLCDQPVSVADTTTATQLFRILQEAINNAAKHARAKTITIEVHNDDGHMVFRIRDDGVGISRNLEETGGMGLRIMQYRAEVIGATLTVRPAAEGGTLVTCSLSRGDYEDLSDVEQGNHGEV